MQSWLQNRWTSLWLLFMGLGALILFLYGFFPLKYHSGKLAHMDDLPNFIDGVSIDGHEVYNAGEYSVILMVIDGLRYDFVTEEYMPYTAKLLKDKAACIYVSVAEPPTVTMPRIKAMMTGSVSTFADVALNFGAPAVRGDSVLRAAAARGRHSVLYGDDTWLRLFPGLWAEYDGTTSFYVTDYTEVDNNVTRHLNTILLADEANKKPKFDFLVLHYLGLDHIGHLEGARSPKIKPKLLEMDEIVKKIHQAMNRWDRNSVLFVCGDHGMRDAGGHGGSSPAEVLVPLVVAKTNDICPHPLGTGPTISQVDVAPSIAWLLNSAVPGDSSGRVLPMLMPTDVRQHLYLLHVLARQNALQTKTPDAEFYKQFQRAEKQFGHYLVTGQQSAAKIAREFYEESLEAMATHLAETTVDLDLFAIGIATLLLFSLSVTLLCVMLYSFQPDHRHKTSRPTRTNFGLILAFILVLFIVMCGLTIACFITETKSQFCSFRALWLPVFILTSCALTTAYFITKTAIEKTRDLTTLKDLNSIDYLLILGTLFHAWSFFGTSFIEEEHMTWYFLWNTLMFFVLMRTFVLLVMYLAKIIVVRATEVQDKPELYKKINVSIAVLPKWVLLIGLHRYLRTMNQTGDRWLFLPDTADWLHEPGHELYLQAHLLIGTLLTTYICVRNLQYTNNTWYIQTVFTIGATICILCYRVTAKALPSPFPDIETWDQVHIVNVFWGMILLQFVFEILTYIGIFKSSDTKHAAANKFVYTKPKEKTEDYFYDPSTEEPWNLEEVKLNLARSISHLMLNSLMLIIILLMRPHNVIMVPSVYWTCVLTSQCIDHNMLDTRLSKNTEVVDILSQTLVHLWIGKVFFFYQGNSNSLASVDLGAGYVGLRQYSAARVAAHMGLHAHAAPALAGAALFCRLARGRRGWPRYLKSVWRTTNIFAAHSIYMVFIYCVITIFFRHHLYVWTVFSPKLLYDFVYIVLTIQALLTIAQIIGLTHVTSWISWALTYKSRL
ncbi:GPI ethanolamine phosphate transferase 2 isoform X2 [Plodia interpunctella]|uniref:GPI ethanolamine phosphate transferase 2 isoform X2 n=1 Tax=Plodia interpunctella TaxID=58824 RepID=UPI0023679AFE|nr:GPI ethanolamine phosphate transferase 2 isoform X2 [Plodia interpunctella]